MRENEENKHRRENIQHSYTFHECDVYAYMDAKLDNGTITFEEVGNKLDVACIVVLEH